MYHVPLSAQVGFINSLKFSSAGDFLVAGVGQEHRWVHDPPEGQGSGARWRWLGSGWEWAYRLGEGWAGPSCSSCPLQAWPMVADQRGSELGLHHPAPQGPRSPLSRLLIPSSSLFKFFPHPAHCLY